MTNPFKKVAIALFARGAVFSLLGFMLLVKTIPSLLNVELGVDVAAGAIGVILMGMGVKDIFAALQRSTRIRTDKLSVHAIDFYYSRNPGTQIPLDLMNADANPNERGHQGLIEWISRVFPRVAYLPYPYRSILHSAVVAVGMGVLGIVILILLRILFSGSGDRVNLSRTLDWYQWLYFIVGFLFWFSVSRYGFRNAIVYQKHLLPDKIVGLFVLLMILAIGVAIAMATSDSPLATPPDLGSLPTILWIGSLLVIVASAALVYFRIKQAPEHYQVHRGEEFFTVSMHPTDIVNSIKSYTSHIGGGAYMHMGSWKPDFKEHTAVQAGEFEADLHAESAIQLNESAGPQSESAIGTALAYLGIFLSAVAGVMLWKSSGGSWIDAQAAILSLRTPIALFIFGGLIYRLGSIAIAEMQWTSVLTYCHVTGTFQTQGGMALMQAGDQTVKGSVLTSATVQPRCAYLNSIGFFSPKLARNNVARAINRVEPAEPVATELLDFIRRQAQQVMAAGTPVAPPATPMLEQSDAPAPPPEDTPGGDDGGNPA